MSDFLIGDTVEFDWIGESKPLIGEIKRFEISASGYHYAIVASMRNTAKPDIDELALYAVPVSDLRHPQPRFKAGDLVAFDCVPFDGSKSATVHGRIIGLCNFVGEAFAYVETAAQSHEPERAGMIAVTIPCSALSPIDAGVTVLPDGSGFCTASYPLPDSHWSKVPGDNIPPAPFGSIIRAMSSSGQWRWTDKVTLAARYAYRVSTMNGKEPDLDPDAFIRNLIIGLIGEPRDVPEAASKSPSNGA